jgi:hypothetical protein
VTFTIPADATGVAASGAVETATASITVSLTGVSADGAVGDVTETNTPTEDGVVATGAVGTLTYEVVLSLSGVGSTGAVQSFANVIPFSGVAASGNAGSVGVLYWGLLDTYQDAEWELVETE